MIDGDWLWTFCWCFCAVPRAAGAVPIMSYFVVKEQCSCRHIVDTHVQAILGWRYLADLWVNVHVKDSWDILSFWGGWFDIPCGGGEKNYVNDPWEVLRVLRSMANPPSHCEVLWCLGLSGRGLLFWYVVELVDKVFTWVQWKQRFFRCAKIINN